MVFEKETHRDMAAINVELVRRIDTNTRRIRTIEQRLDIVERRMGAIEEKIIDEIDRLRRGFEQISMDTKKISKNLIEIRKEMLNMNKDLDKAAKKSEVKELESLLEIYNPIKSSFVTREEVKNLIDEKLSKKT